MKWQSLAALVLVSPFSAQTYAQEPKTLTFDKPVALTARKLQPYEVIPGTIISLVLLSPNEIVPVAEATTNIFDFYRNIVIPKGSRLVGKYIKKVNDRHQVIWDGLQLPSLGGTLRINPPIPATSQDGSAGLVDFTPGARAAAITEESFFVPH